MRNRDRGVRQRMVTDLQSCVREGIQGIQLAQAMVEVEESSYESINVS
jgi:hypothetical protein